MFGGGGGGLQHWQTTALPWWQTHGHGVKLSSLVTTTRYAHQRNGVYCEYQELAHIKAIKGDPCKVSLWCECVSNVTAAVCCLCHALVVLLKYFFNVSVYSRMIMRHSQNSYFTLNVYYFTALISHIDMYEDKQVNKKDRIYIK